MTTTVHKNLTGSDLHEPKGADTALVNQVYVSNGAGSGTWQTASSIITNQAFTTGDGKITLKTTADSGWVLVDDGTIGDASSGATTRANADTSALFALLWALPVGLTVSSGRGASAILDFAAHKTIALPKTLGRALVIAGAGSGLTSRTLASIVGEETHQLTTAELAQTFITPTMSQAAYNFSLAGANPVNVQSNSSGTTVVASLSQANTATTRTSDAAINQFSFGSNVAHNNMQPSSFWNVMVKL